MNYMMRLEKTVQYYDKIQLEGLIIEQSDIYIRFVTNKDLATGSIVYPKNKDKRWWRTIDSVEKDDHYLVDALLSDYQPDFGD